MATDLLETDVLIVDGANTLWRACYANAGLGYQTEAGFQPTGGVYGFFESVISVLSKCDTESPPDVWIVWEGARSRAVRRAVLPTYKRRAPDPKREKLAKLVGVQASILRSCLGFTSFSQATADGWEGDDAMATIAARCRLNGLNATIYSGDADLLQTLRDSASSDQPPFDADLGWIAQYKPTTKEGVDPFWTAARIRSEWGFEPELVADVKAIGGDSSDGYKGVPGIGEVWARRIVAAHGGVEKIVRAAEAGEVAGSAKKAESILENREALEACYQIALVNESVPIDIVAGTADNAELKRIFARLRFHSINTPAKLKVLS